RRPTTEAPGREWHPDVVLPSHRRCLATAPSNCSRAGTRSAAIRASKKSSPRSRQKSPASKRRNGSEEILRRADAAHFKTPHSVTFVKEISKTATGKIQKYVLRAQQAAIAPQ